MNFEEILPGIYLLKMPFSIVFTGVILIKGEKNFLIDSGSEAPDTYLLPALRRIGVKPEEIDWLLNTHSHGDHITAHAELVERFGIKTAVISEGEKNLTDPAANAISIRTRFPEHSPAPQSWLKGVVPDKVLKEGELLEGRLTPIHTPGHDSDCVCWYDTVTKTIFTGDSLQANGTPTQGIGFYRSLSDYRKTLDKLASYTIENIVCGHEYDGIGSVIYGKENVKKALAACQHYVTLYEQKIREKCESGETDPVKIATDLIEEVGCGMPEKLFLALYTITQHMEEINQ